LRAAAKYSAAEEEEARRCGAVVLDSMKVRRIEIECASAAEDAVERAWHCKRLASCRRRKARQERQRRRGGSMHVGAAVMVARG